MGVISRYPVYLYFRFGFGLTASSIANPALGDSWTHSGQHTRTVTGSDCVPGARSNLHVAPAGLIKYDGVIGTLSTKKQLCPPHRVEGCMHNTQFYITQLLFFLVLQNPVRGEPKARKYNCSIHSGGATGADNVWGNNKRSNYLSVLHIVANSCHRTGYTFLARFVLTD